MPKSIAMPGVAGVARVSGLTIEEIEDRVYRLHYNRGQNRTDLFATVPLGHACSLGMPVTSWRHS